MTTRGQSVSARLRDGILSGRIGGGARLNEAELAAEFQVSRTPIRAALAGLAAEGLLDYTPNAGYVVKSYSAEHVAGVFEVRAALEGLAARQAVENGLSDAQRGRMHGVLSDTEAFLRRARYDDDIADFWADANASFHGAIRQASQNAHLQWLAQRSRDIPLLRTALFRSTSLERIAKAHDEHVEILGALVNRQAARAEALAREHMYRAGVFIVERWRQLQMHAPAEAGAQWTARDAPGGQPPAPFADAAAPSPSSA